MQPGIPEFLLSGGQGGLTVSPSSTSTSGRVQNSLNFGTSGSGNGITSMQILLIGGFVLGAIFLMGRK